jgi:hypothetical protein
MDYPQGLSILLGTVPPPTIEEISEMLDMVRQPTEPTLDPAGNFLRVDGGSDFIEADAMLDNADRFNRVVERSGGWEKINEVMRGWVELYPSRWTILVDYVVWVRNRAGNLDGSILYKIAAKHSVSHDTVSRIGQTFPQMLATAIMYALEMEKKFELGEINNIEAV